MTRWGCPACGRQWAVRLLAGCPRCPDHPALVEEGDMPKATVHSGSSNGLGEEPVEVLQSDEAELEVEQPQPDVTVPAKPAPADVRAWAAANSIDVKPSGPIPAAVVEQYRQAVA